MRCASHCSTESHSTCVLLGLLPHFTDGETEARERKGLSLGHTEIKGWPGWAKSQL